ncbi:hypothetical protein RhiJN_08718 [Ceratobasidium sp. AG-Ba]|nr:hypothetical protein RhiJN_08718 [Ceratobasidium sp. AG-Ba]QRW09497.1 hypothetical protein RhiLY_08496 [Ceratobasidium sp. AG-Ba]
MLAKSGEKGGDMVYENAILFMREGLNVRELTTSTKRGDSGRILNVCKIFALSFRGSGRLRYANEMLTLIHHATTVWPEALRNLVLKNWLLNPTGHPDSFVPLDLVQEHGNLYIKTIYSAQGSNASWSWLSVISPCVEALRALSRDLNSTIGSYLDLKHSSPDTSMDIQKIIDSLDRHHVYRIQPGRTLEGKDDPVPDIETLGMTKLLDGYPSGLSEYNKLFKASQNSLRQPCVSQMISHTTLPQTPKHASGIGSTSKLQAVPMNQTESQEDWFEGETDGSESENDNAFISDEEEDDLVEALKAPGDNGEGGKAEWESTDDEDDVEGDEE